MLDKDLQKHLELTEEQEPAVTQSGSNLLVSAGAGSGKTRVLTARFANLVLTQKAGVRELLAITFTDKAASEMKERLVKLFSDIGKEDLRREVEEAYVSTMHSFASRLLKEYALEAGVDPDFQVMPEDEQIALENEVWETFLEEYAEDEDVYSLLLEFDTKKDLRSEMTRLRRSLNAAAIDTLEESYYSSEAINKFKSQSIGSLETILKEIGVSKDLTESESGSLAKLKAAAAELKRPHLEEADASLIEEASKISLPRKDEVRKGLFNEARIIAKGILLLSKDKASLLMRGRMKSLIEKYESQLQAEKRKRSVLDYDDLLNELLRFLRRKDAVAEEVRRALQKKFRYILMDELQDSNRVEAEILRRLSTGNNLFLVGDAKQSIYSFREADVGIFLSLEQRAESKEPEKGNDLKILRLQDNYRSKPELLDFTNNFFGEKIFKNSPIVYQNMNYPHERQATNDQRRIECITAEASGGEETVEKEVRQRWEAEALADRILELKEQGLVSGLRFGEIAILLKNLTTVNVYEKALREKGIPYSVVAGRGFYQKTEIMDIVNFLKIVGNPSDDIALAGLLRSPLVNISDDSLMILASERTEPFSLWSAVRQSACREKLSAADRKKLRSFLEFRKKLQDQKSRIGISELIRKIIAGTHYDSKVLLETDGRQKFANLEKLAEMASGFDRKNLDLPAFLKRLEEKVIEEVREAEASSSAPDEDSVQIMTIHKAKGLEFRVVAAANFDAGSKNEGTRFNYANNWGAGYKEQGAKTGDFRFEKNREEAKVRKEHEIDRLFYVACTRAKEHLILSTAPSSQDAHNRFLKRLREHFGPEGAFNNINFVEVNGPGKSGTALSSLIEDPKIARTVLSGKPEEPSGEEKRKWEKIYKDISVWDFPSKPSAAVSVTALLDFVESPEKYYQNHFLRSPLALSREQVKPGENDEDEADEESIEAREYGTIFHSILERWDLSRKPLETYEQVKKEISAALPQASRKRLEKELYLFAMNPLADNLVRSKAVERELAFEWEPEKHFKTRGIIDLLYQAEDGAWCLVDYKTGKMETDTEVEEKRKHYEFQLSAYGSVLIQALNLERLRCSLYFSSLGKLVTWELAKKDSEKFKDILLNTLKKTAETKF